MSHSCLHRAVASCFVWVAITVPAAAAPVDDFATELEQRVVTTPAGDEITILGDLADGAILDRERLTQCIETIERAEAWPEVWLVVQDQALDYDLVVFLRRESDDGAVEAPLAVALSRADRDHRGLRDAVRDATGARLPAKVRNVVVRGFRVRIDTRYVYDPPSPEARADGLLALLSEGALLRDAMLVDLGDGAMHTLAIVMQDVRFVPSGCGDCGKRAGHLDAGSFRMVLASSDAIEAELDLGPLLRPDGGEAFLPRFRCEPGDEAVSPQDTVTVRGWLAGRQPSPLMDRVDIDRDGRALEIALPTNLNDCDDTGQVVIAIDPAGPSLVVLD